MLIIERTFLFLSQQMRSADDILDLSAVQLQLCQLVELFVGESRGVGPAEELAPDLATGDFIELGVLDGNVNTGFKCCVYLLGSIGGQE
jgi:hypothetical protein